MGKTADVTGDRFCNSRVASHERDLRFAIAVVTFTTHGLDLCSTHTRFCSTYFSLDL
ncbi:MULTISPECIES: hypothetical protein [unclassified Nostoc]|uniref:hypothetical protein n=1 Tax=unclassified Nostoc TaxID=2593658 RepID=UPI00159F2699|nr:hypothetical protein [Nostoc sp. KVJ20]